MVFRADTFSSKSFPSTAAGTEQNCPRLGERKVVFPFLFYSWFSGPQHGAPKVRQPKSKVLSDHYRFCPSNPWLLYWMAASRTFLLPKFPVRDLCSTFPLDQKHPLSYRTGPSRAKMRIGRTTGTQSRGGCSFPSIRWSDCAPWKVTKRWVSGYKSQEVNKQHRVLRDPGSFHPSIGAQWPSHTKRAEDSGRSPAMLQGTTAAKSTHGLCSFL